MEGDNLGSVFESVAYASMRPRFRDRGRVNHVRKGRESVRASMRPRFRDRGRALQTAVRKALESGFNEATVQRPWKATSSTKTTWKPGASMRPRFRDRGRIVSDAPVFGIVCPLQ